MSQRGFAPIFLLFVVAVVILTVAAYNLGKNSPKISEKLNDNKQAACTLEAKICPDGSSVGRSGPNCEFAECPTPAPLKVVVPSEWEVYKGECAYSDQVSCPFAIGYPKDWMRVGNALYPEQKADTGAPYIVLGVGGRGLGNDFTVSQKSFNGGEATYWKKVHSDDSLSVIASFSGKDIVYNFEGYNLNKEQEQTFLKMLNSFSY